MPIYESQSPVFNVLKIQTPFMILQGPADGAVDWDQGPEFYNAARTNGRSTAGAQGRSDHVVAGLDSW